MLRPKKSIDQAISNVTKLVFRCIEEWSKCITIYIDFTKAFDTVDHIDFQKNAWQMLYRFGSIIFESYLEYRKQRVKVNVSISKAQSIKCIVSWGKTLSPVPMKML